MRLLHVDRLTGTPARVLALRRARRRRRGRSHHKGHSRYRGTRRGMARSHAAAGACPMLSPKPP